MNVTTQITLIALINLITHITLVTPMWGLQIVQ
jgi:hypothetical protein